MQPTTELKAIETVYHNYRFRSRLEARWAVFFDVVGFRYLYEPEGYDLGGIWYLPDFYLPDPKAFVEIKPEDPTDEQRHKAHLLAIASGKQVWILSGQPYVGEYHIWAYGDDYQDCCPLWFTQCSKCIRIGIESASCFGFCCGEHSGWAESPRLLDGYEAARKARFDGKDSTTYWPGPAAMVQANENITDSEIWLTNELHLWHEYYEQFGFTEQERWKLYERAKQRRIDFNKRESDAVLAMLEL